MKNSIQHFSEDGIKNLEKAQENLAMNPDVTGKPANPKIQKAKAKVKIGFEYPKPFNSVILAEYPEFSRTTTAENTPKFIKIYVTR